ncbi:MAG: LPS-assembly protein LptD [Acidobacteria bacterium]|nr:LPS-assembly protein LptD [Acidobacteriota bacterium]
MFVNRVALSMRFLLVLLCCLTFVSPDAVRAQQPARASVEFPSQEGTIVIEADRIERTGPDDWTASGSVRVTLGDILISTDELEYNAQTHQVRTPRRVRFSQALHWVEASRMEMNLRTQLGTFYDADGFTDQEFYFQAEVVRKVARDVYRVEDGFVTSCQEALPKWSFAMGEAEIRVKGTLTARNTVFRVKKVPIFYVPYLRLPLQRKERASGFLFPSTGTSNNKGRRFSESFYLTLGESADLTLTGDYFSERGMGYGTRFRARPNPETRLEFYGYFVKDRLRQGGASFSALAETRLGNGFRGVALFDVVSNFAFRQVYSDTFRAATTPNQNSIFFLTNNFGSLSFNFALNREETFFPLRSVVVWNAPRVQLRSVGTPLGKNFYLEFESTLEALNRSDSVLKTPRFVQRLDLFPRVYYAGLKTAYFSLVPRLGVRETYYSDSRDTESGGLAGRALHRSYGEAQIDLMGPVLERRFDIWGGLRHSLEPTVRYRWIEGIRRYRQVLRFDETDAVADTHQLEYALTQRFFRRVAMEGGGETPVEAASFRITQQYFLDRSFGGALDPGQINQFYPANTVTGFLYATERRSFSPVTALLRFSPSYRYSVDVRTDYDTQLGGFRNSSVTGYLSVPGWFAGATYFLTRKLDPSSFTRHQIQMAFSYGELWKGASASTLFNYDIQTPELQNSITRINYFWDCCGVSLEFLQFKVNLRNESQLRFSFYLKGLGTFGTIPQPERNF